MVTSASAIRRTSASSRRRRTCTRRRTRRPSVNQRTAAAPSPPSPHPTPPTHPPPYSLSISTSRKTGQIFNQKLTLKPKAFLFCTFGVLVTKRYSVIFGFCGRAGQKGPKSVWKYCIRKIDIVPRFFRHASFGMFFLELIILITRVPFKPKNLECMWLYSKIS